MGGHAGGDVASHIAVNHLIALDREFTTLAAASRALKAQILAANKMIVEVVDTYPQLAGLGTTLSAILRVGNRAVVAHIGDSRVYVQRDALLTQVTKDHTFVQRLIDSGQITEAEALIHPRRSVLMRVLGDVDATPSIDTVTVDLLPGDTWLLCSDGLTGCLSDSEIATLITAHSTVDALASALIERTLSEGAHDNVTVVVSQVAATETAQRREPALVGSANGDNPLKVLPKATDTGPTIPRAKAASLPVHTGGIPIAGSVDDEPDEVPILASAARPRIARAVWLTILIAVVVIGAAVWLVLASSGSSALSSASSTALSCPAVFASEWGRLSVS
jgi:protein phosphatase